MSTFAEARLPHKKIQAPVDAPSKTSPLSPLDELELLERSAREKGMSHDELTKTRHIGDCPVQVQTRITRLHEWLAAH